MTSNRGRAPLPQQQNRTCAYWDRPQFLLVGESFPAIVRVLSTEDCVLEKMAPLLNRHTRPRPLLPCTNDSSYDPVYRGANVVVLTREYE